MTRNTFTGPLAGVLLLAGCSDMGSAYRPVLDGPEGPGYGADLQACQALARAQPLQEETVGAAIAGGIFGGIAGDHEGDVTFAQGAVAGALFGLIGGLTEELDAREAIIVTCMQGRGHRVVG